MIVRNQSDGSVVMITQNDHAKLAGLFAAHWGNGRFERPRPYLSAVRAAQYHDAGWLRYETNPRFDPATGRTPNYQEVPNDDAQLAAYQGAIDMLAGVDGYTAHLVSRHRTGLWQSRYSVMTEPAPGPPRKLSEAVKAFIARNEATQREWAAGADQRELAVNYNLLQVWDLLSLYICSNETLKEHVIGPAPTAYADGSACARLRLTPHSPTRIAVEPFPFDRPALEVGVVCRRLSRNDFHDTETFQTAYFAAAPQLATFTFVDEATA